MSESATAPNPQGDPRVADVRTRLAAAHTASASAPEKAQAKLDAQGKIYVRDRFALLFDEGSFVEDGRYANALQPGLPADGVVTGRGTVDGRPAIVIANDPTVKAGSWGARTIFSTVRAPHEPALTVGSLAMTIAARPSTVPRPVTTPSAGSPGCRALA